VLTLRHSEGRAFTVLKLRDPTAKQADAAVLDPACAGFKQLAERLFWPARQQNVASRATERFVQFRYLDWHGVLGALRRQVHEEVDATSGGSASFSEQKVVAVRKRVRDFMDTLNRELRRLGLVLASDGRSALHFFAILTTWQLFTAGEAEASYKSLTQLTQDKEKWRAYFVSTLRDDAKALSISAAERFVSHVERRLTTSAMEDGKDEVRDLLKDVEKEESNDFDPKRVLKKLDEKYLFAERKVRLAVSADDDLSALQAHFGNGALAET
jgi:hypothetical protein